MKDGNVSDDDNDEGHNRDEDDESGCDDENESSDGKDGMSNAVTGWFGRFNFFFGAHPGSFSCPTISLHAYVICLHGKRRHTLLLHHISI